MTLSHGGIQALRKVFLAELMGKLRLKYKKHSHKLFHSAYLGVEQNAEKHPAILPTVGREILFVLLVLEMDHQHVLYIAVQIVVDGVLQLDGAVLFLKEGKMLILNHAGRKAFRRIRFVHDAVAALIVIVQLFLEEYELFGRVKRRQDDVIIFIYQIFRKSDVVENASNVELIPNGGVYLIPYFRIILFGKVRGFNDFKHGGLCGKRKACRSSHFIREFYPCPLRDVRVIARCGVQRKLVGLRMDKIVAVNEADVLPSCNSKPCVAGLGQPAVFFMDHKDSRIPCGIFVADFGAVIGRSVIYEEELKVCKGLGENTVNATAQKGLNLVYGNDDANFGRAFF